MRSLRTQLLVGTALAAAAVLLIAGIAAYVLIDRALRTEFDAALAARARALVAFFEQDNDELEFDLLEIKLPEYEPSPDAEYYQVWIGDDVFARSPSLQAVDLPRLAGSLAAPAFQTATLPDHRSGRLVGITFHPRIESAGHTTTPLSVTLVLARATDNLAATLAQVRWLLLTVGFCAILASSLVLAWLVRRNLRPVVHLGEQIAALDARDLAARVDAAHLPTELAPIADRLNGLLARLQGAFDRERRFTGDAAHELRTPLAGLRSQIEVALSRERDPAAYQATLRDCLDIQRQMERLVETLLQLARADASRTSIERATTQRESVDLAALARECWTALEPAATQRGLTLDWTSDTSTEVTADRDLLRLVLHNLLENAVAYAPPNGRIELTIARDDDANAAELTIRNSTDLPPADAERVFERFWRADASRQQHNGARYGLGLPLCKALVEQHGGTITARVDPPGVFTIQLRLPSCHCS